MIATGSRKIIVFNDDRQTQEKYHTISTGPHPPYAKMRAEVIAHDPTGSLGNRMIRHAMSPHPSDPDLAVARDQGGKVVGAMSYSHEKDAYAPGMGDHVHVHYLGSTGDQPGVGRNLMRHVLSHAEQHGKSVGLSSLPDAEPFYDKLGMHRTGADEHGMTRYHAPAQAVKGILDKLGRTQEGEKHHVRS